MDLVVYTTVTGAEATDHLTVGGVYNGVTAQRGNIAPPEIQPILYGREVVKICNTFSLCFLLQVSVLYP